MRLDGDVEITLSKSIDPSKRSRRFSYQNRTFYRQHINLFVCKIWTELVAWFVSSISLSTREVKKQDLRQRQNDHQQIMNIYGLLGVVIQVLLIALFVMEYSGAAELPKKWGGANNRRRWLQTRGSGKFCYFELRFQRSEGHFSLEIGSQFSTKVLQEITLLMIFKFQHSNVHY